MKILGIDLESNHHDPETAKITEFAFVLFDTELGQPLELETYLVKEVGIEPLSELIIRITGITDGMIEEHGESPFFVISRFLRMYAKADYVLAHNGTNFDRPLVRNFLKRYLSEGEAQLVTPKPWIDSLVDVDYPEECSHRSMTYLQGFYSLVNPFKHRALTDILTTLTILHKNFSWSDIVEISKSPFLRFIAEVDYHERDVAKDARFKWDAARKIWFRDIKKVFVDRKAISFEFKHGAVWLDAGEEKCAKELTNSKCVCKPCAAARYQQYIAQRDQELKERQAALRT